MNQNGHLQSLAYCQHVHTSTEKAKKRISLEDQGSCYHSVPINPHILSQYSHTQNVDQHKTPLNGDQSGMVVTRFLGPQHTEEMTRREVSTLLPLRELCRIPAHVLKASCYLDIPATWTHNDWALSCPTDAPHNAEMPYLTPSCSSLLYSVLSSVTPLDIVSTSTKAVFQERSVFVLQQKCFPLACTVLESLQGLSGGTTSPFWP